MIEVAGIILAAGISSRMNGILKPVLPFHGKPMLQHVVDNALESSLDQVIVVLGNACERIIEAVRFKQAMIVFNPEFAKGQSSSLKAGISAVADTCEGALFMLGDQPLVDSGIIDAVIGRFRDTRMPIVVPSYCGKPGNPVFFARSFFPEILTLEGDIGARPLLAARKQSIATVEVGHDGIHLDVDTWEDYARLLDKTIGNPPSE